MQVPQSLWNGSHPSQRTRMLDVHAAPNYLVLPDDAHLWQQQQILRNLVFGTEENLPISMKRTQQR